MTEVSYETTYLITDLVGHVSFLVIKPLRLVASGKHNNTKLNAKPKDALLSLPPPNSNSTSPNRDGDNGERRDHCIYRSIGILLQLSPAHVNRASTVLEIVPLALCVLCSPFSNVHLLVVLVRN